MTVLPWVCQLIGYFGVHCGNFDLRIDKVRSARWFDKSKLAPNVFEGLTVRHCWKKALDKMAQALTLENLPSHHLGAEILKCNRRSRAAVNISLFGPLGIIQLVLILPLCVIVFTCGLALLVSRFTEAEGQVSLIAALTGAFVTTAMALYLYILLAPREPALVLYEHGFRYKRRYVNFSELAMIAVGQGDSVASQMVSGLRKLTNWLPGGRAAESSVKLVFANSAELSFPRFLAESDHNDLDRFFDCVKRDHAVEVF